MSKIEVNEIVKASGSTLTIGGCGTAVTLGSGATQSGFGRSGSVNWQTTPKTSTFTAVSGEGYFINQGSAITMNLPAGSAGAIVAVSDYARNFATYNLTISPNGSEKIGGEAEDLTLNVNGQALTLVYVDSTKGWINVQNAEDTETGIPPFIVASGGTETSTPTCKIHTFTSPGNFVVSQISTTPANNVLSYMVVAGGAGGAQDRGGGGGAGGFREDKSPVTPYTASPLDGAGSISATVTTFPIVVGSGGAGGPTSGGGSAGRGTPGSVSTFSTITSAGGGGGAPGCAGPTGPSARNALSGGSGGGGGSGNDAGGSGGAGNTPPVSPSQGTSGGTASNPSVLSAGGGGATVAGANGAPSSNGAGGTGATTSINNSPVTYAGGGGGGIPSGTVGPGGSGGGGAGGGCSGAVAGTANTGGGGGGGGNGQVGASGGSGIVIIRYKIA
jgi:hypothetical protein